MTKAFLGAIMGSVAGFGMGFLMGSFESMTPPPMVMPNGKPYPKLGTMEEVFSTDIEDIVREVCEMMGREQKRISISVH